MSAKIAENIPNTPESSSPRHPYNFSLLFGRPSPPGGLIARARVEGESGAPLTKIIASATISLFFLAKLFNFFTKATLQSRATKYNVFSYNFVCDTLLSNTFRTPKPFQQQNSIWNLLEKTKNLAGSIRSCLQLHSTSFAPPWLRFPLNISSHTDMSYILDPLRNRLTGEILDVILFLRLNDRFDHLMLYFMEKKIPTEEWIVRIERICVPSHFNNTKNRSKDNFLT